MMFQRKLQVGDRVVIIVDSRWYRLGEEYTIDRIGAIDVHITPDSPDPSHLKLIK